MEHGPPSDDPVQALVLECLDRMEREGEGVVDELCRAHPEHAALLRSRLRALREAGLVEPAPGELEPDFPERLGDFRLLERLHVGGMGVVYLAEQESLGRRVAVKLVRPELMYFPGARERFRREVEAVARLSHPGVVPVYTVGEERGLPYFAMQHVAGLSLAQVLEELSGRAPASLTGADLRAVLARCSAGEGLAPAGEARAFTGSWTEACLSIALELARVLRHAHGRRVLHRDLKPSNVMLDPAGHVHVVDFGLATLHGASRLTRTGSQLGSLPYMAPEQLRGEPEALGPHTDVYGLGVTLYELLTLRLPHVGASPAALEREILAGTPRSMRRWNPSLSRDVETVCLTAIRAERARRYATMSAFARDLSNLLECRPIEARRTSLAGRAWRLARRHPAGSSAAALAALLVMGGPLVFLRQQYLANSALAAQRDEALAESRRADRTSELATGLVELMLHRSGDDRLAGLQELLERSEREAPEALGERTSLSTLDARLARYLGDALRLTGRYEAAERAYRRHVAACRREAERTGDRRGWEGELASGLNELANCLHLQLRPAEALDAYAEALGLQSRRARERAGEREPLRSLATLHRNIARIQLDERLLEEARASYAAAIAAGERLLALEPGAPEALDVLGMAVEGQAELLVELGDTDAARESRARAVALLEQLVAVQPARPGPQRDLAVARMNQGVQLAAAGELEPAAAAFARAEQLARALVAGAPEAPAHRALLRDVRANQGGLGGLRAEPARARAAFAEALALGEALVRSYPDTPAFRVALGFARNDRVVFLLEQGALDEAAAALPELLALAPPALSLAGLPTADRRRAIALGVSVAGCALALREPRAAEEVLDELARLDWPEAPLHLQLAEGYATCAQAPATGEAARAALLERGAGELLRALELGYTDRDELERAPELAALLSRADVRAGLERLAAPARPR